MKSTLNARRIQFAIAMGILLNNSPTKASTQDNASDEHIRKIIENLLREKYQKIEQLEARIRQLENNQASRQANVQIKPSFDQTDASNNPAQKESVENLAIPALSILAPSPGAVAKAKIAGYEYSNDQQQKP